MTSDFTQFVLDQLVGLGKLRARRMFGGVGIYCDEVFFAIIHQDTLYFKVDDSTRAAFVQAGCVAFKPSAHRAMTLQYYARPADELESAPSLRDWAREALAVARRVPQKKPPVRNIRQSH